MLASIDQARQVSARRSATRAASPTQRRCRRRVARPQQRRDRRRLHRTRHVEGDFRRPAQRDRGKQRVFRHGLIRNEAQPRDRRIGQAPRGLAGGKQLHVHPHAALRRRHARKLEEASKADHGLAIERIGVRQAPGEVAANDRLVRSHERISKADGYARSAPGWHGGKRQAGHLRPQP